MITALQIITEMKKDHDLQAMTMLNKITLIEERIKQGHTFTCAFGQVQSNRSCICICKKG